MNFLAIGSGILICTGLFLIFWLQRGAPTEKTTNHEDSLVGEVRGLLNEFYPDTALTYNSETDTFEPDDENGDGPRMFLGNLRSRTQDMSESDRLAFMRSFLGHVSQETEITPEILRESLLMRNRTPEEFSNRQIMMTPTNDEDPFESIIIAKGEMLFEPVLDLDNALQPMTVDIMRKHGFAFDEFIQLASQNLLKVTPEKTTEHWELIAENIWISKLNDDYDAARLFLFPEQLSLPIEGPLIAYAPSHAICLITGQTDSETLRQMIELGNQSSETHRPLSQALWQQTEAGWSRMQSNDRNSVEGRAYLIETLNAYDDQQSSLTQYFEKTDQDIHVSKIITRSHEKVKDGPIIETLSVFIGQGSYLPKTDFVVLSFDENLKEGDLSEIGWDKFIEIIGKENLRPHPDYLPVRFIYTGTLSQDKIDALNVAATQL